MRRIKLRRMAKGQRSKLAKSIPLIRSAVLAPMTRWLQANERPVLERLRAADLGCAYEGASEVPIPLWNVLEFFRQMGVAEGFDIGARVVTPNSLADLGMLGRIILGSRTPRNALERVAASLPRYCSHELLTLEPIPGGLCVRAGWSLVLDDELMHLTQQFSATLILGLCAATGREPSTPRSIRIRPHPHFGLDHLQYLFGPQLHASKEATLEVDIDDILLDTRLQIEALPAEPLFSDWQILMGDSSFRHSARCVIEAFAGDPPVTLDRVANAAKRSRRSVQRALTHEGTSFRRLSDEVRRDRALRALPAIDRSLSSVATDLGYMAQSSLCRAVRRWTGSTPNKVMSTAKRVSSKSLKGTIA